MRSIVNKHYCILLFRDSWLTNDDLSVGLELIVGIPAGQAKLNRFSLPLVNGVSRNPPFTSPHLFPLLSSVDSL